MKLLVDLSPVLYGNIFSATNEAEKLNFKKDSNGNYNFDLYKNVFIFKVFEELSLLKNKFQADDVIICVDAGNYWRKDVWKGYKHKRKEQRDKTAVDWVKAQKANKEIIQMLHNTSFKVIEVPKSEGDDIVFILSEYLALKGEDVVIYSSDHDFIQCLEHNNVKFWRTTRTQGMQNSKFYELNEGELVHIILDHVIGGDSGDGINNIKGYSRFSSKFKEKYPNKTELEVYSKRFELDELFKKTYGVSAYSHPRYGYKMFLKSKKTLEQLLEENPIYKLNYKLNRQIALPEGIPADITSKIIGCYENYNHPKSYFKLQNYFVETKTPELIGSLLLF